MKEKKSLTGTARYASLNAHCGFEQSRRDDMEGLGMVFVYLLKGSLPWQGMNGATKDERYTRIIEKKKSITPQMLCSGLPKQFLEYFTYVRNLEFEEKPDYHYLKTLFKSLYHELGFTSYDRITWEENDDKSSNTTDHLDSLPPVKKEDDTSKAPICNVKSRNELSFKDNTDCTQKKPKMSDNHKTLIHVPYTDTTFKCKVFIDTVKFASSGKLNMGKDDIPDEKDCNIYTHLPTITDYKNDKPNKNSLPADVVKKLLVEEHKGFFAST